MPRPGICLETVDVSSDPPREVDAIWITPDRARYLLDLLAIDTTAPEYLAIDSAAAPDFSWWWVMYERCLNAGGSNPALGVWPHPPKDYCHEPGAILAALKWLRAAITTDGILKREQFWRWYRPDLPYDATRFAVPFHDELDSWCSACKRAQARGMKVALRVGE